MKRPSSKKTSAKKHSSIHLSPEGKNYLPDGFERLRVLSAQLYAVIMAGSWGDMHHWHPEVRDYYMWLMTDMSQEVRDGIQGMVNASTPRPLDERIKEQRKAG